MKLLLVGATGLVGSETLALALNDARISHITVLSRRSLSPHPKLTNIIVDFDKLDDIAHAPYLKVDAGICALGTTRQKTPSDAAYRRIDIDYPQHIAKLIRANNAYAFAHVSSANASSSSLMLYLRMKAEAENALMKIGFPSLTIVRPGPIAGKRAEPRMMEIPFFALMQGIAFLLPKKYRPIDAKKIATRLINAVVNAKRETSIIESDMI